MPYSTAVSSDRKLTSRKPTVPWKLAWGQISRQFWDFLQNAPNAGFSSFNNAHLGENTLQFSYRSVKWYEDGI
jgi:hypothetical protein